MEREGRGIHETWKDFGKNLQAFLEREKSSLSDNKYNVIAGFTSGGSILATALASQLKEEFVDAYSSPSTGAIRTIPSGIHKKTYDRPDFVMASPCAEEDLEDLEQFVRELGTFQSTNQLDRLSVLLVDDNLTGSTRMRYFRDRLQELGSIDVDLLAYARNPRITLPVIKYFVRKDPIQPDEYLIMPWHKVHGPRGVGLQYSGAKLLLSFNNPKRLGFEDIKDILTMFIPPDKQPNRIEADDRTLQIKRGETVVQFLLSGNRLLMKIPGNMFYPPKGCLSGKGPSFGTRSLCTLGGTKLLGICCRACSAIYCSLDIIGIIERNMGMEFLDIRIDAKGSDQEPLRHVEESLRELMRSDRKDPSDLRFLPLDQFLALAQEEQLGLRDNIETINGAWIEKTLKSLDALWIITLGDEVIKHGKDLTDAPSLEDIMPLAEERHLVPFLFIRLNPVEEGAPWNHCGKVQQRDDWYPAIRIRISSVRTDNEKHLEFYADFDTGNPYIHLDGESLYRQNIVPPPNFFNRNKNMGDHVGTPYKGYPAPVKLEVLNGDRAVAATTMQVICVLDWPHSPFVLQGPNRHRTAFVGRQIFRFMGLRTILDSATHTTSIEGTAG